MDNRTFIYITYIATTPEKLWKALTSTEFTKQYWGRRIESDWKVGSPVKMLMDDGKIDWQGEVLKYEPPHLLSYTFHFEWIEQLRSEPNSRVTFALEQKGKVVKLTVTHDELSQNVYADISKGWPHILSSLKSLLETGNVLDLND